MSIILKDNTHGHNVHGFNRGERRHDAHQSRGRALLVHRRDHSDPARVGGRWIRRVGHPRGASLLPFRPSEIGRKIKEVAKVATAVLIGLSFASPVLAFDETDTWNRDYTRNLQELGGFYVHLTPDCSSVFTPAGNNTVGGFYFAPQEHDIVLDSFDQVMGIFSGQGFVTSTVSVDLSLAISETSGQLQVVNPSDIGHFSQVAYFADNIPTASKKFWTIGSPGNTGYGTSTFVAPTFPGEDLRVILKVGKVYRFQFEEADANPLPTDGGYFVAIPDGTIYSDATSTAVRIHSILGQKTNTL